ncbi:pentapeptide repeat-containing protein [Maridesulfovibrio sp.]|uniref:pentapeptide repeat-containing protein n=1 Tax=Maridesulfovibrio sp. TaxID=2795000 RepID=UPI003BAA9F0E
MENKDWILLGLAFTPLVLVYLYSYNYEVFYFLYNYSGARAIKQLLSPPPKKELDDANYRSPSTFILWIVSIYVAIFGLASNRYEGAVNTYVMQISNFQNQMTSEYRAVACGDLSRLQSIKTPIKPEIFDVFSTINSFFSKEEYAEGQKLLISTIEMYKYKLSRAFLIKANLSRINFWRAELKRANLKLARLNKANLSYANLQGANLKSANLKEANLWRANLSGAGLSTAILLKTNLTKANLKKANLTLACLKKAGLTEAVLNGADLRGADLTRANLEKADLKGANLKGACLIRVNLSEAKLHGVDLTKVSSLYKATLPPETEKLLQKTQPQLFVKPDWYTGKE